MRRYLNKDDVPALHDAESFRVPDSVEVSLFSIAARLPFPGRGVELSGVLDLYKGSGFDDAKVREARFLAVKYIERRLHLERLVRSPVLEVHSRHEQLPPHERWQATVCKHAPNHGAQSPPHVFRHTAAWWWR